MKKLSLDEEERLLYMLDIKRSDQQFIWFMDLLKKIRNEEVLFMVNETDHIQTDLIKGRVQVLDFILSYWDNLPEKMEKFKQRNKRK